MYAHIEKPKSSSKNALDYNYEKIKNKKAQVLHANRIPGWEYKEFVYDMILYRESHTRANAKNLSFHMSVNPAIGEVEDDDTAVALINDLMEEMGFKDQPYVIIRHDDIDRRHFHVVSTWIDRSLRLIPDWKYNERLLAAEKKLAPKYGYEVAKPEARPIEEITSFDPKGERLSQIDQIIDLANKYYTGNLEEYAAVMATMGVQITSKTKSQFHFRGLDEQGKICTTPVKGIKAHKQLAISERLTSKTRTNQTEQKKNSYRNTILERINQSLLNTESWDELCDDMVSWGITVSENEGNIWLIDHPAGLVFTARELDLEEELLRRRGDHKMKQGRAERDIWEAVEEIQNRQAHEQAMQAKENQGNGESLNKKR